MDTWRRKLVMTGAGSALTSTATAVLLASCGGGGGDSAPAGVAAPPPSAAPPPGAALSCGDTAISGNHGHALSVPAADLDATVTKIYSILGSALHDHTVTLTPAQLAQIKAKTSVTVESSLNGHVHSVTVNCT